MKQAHKIIRWFGATVILVLLLSVSSVVAIYRLPCGPAVTIEGEVLYKLADFGGGFRGLVFEHYLGNKRAWLTDNSVLYVNAADFNKLWEDKPSDMKKSQYTKYAVFNASNLCFDDYGIAELKEIRIIHKPPTTTK